MNNYRISHRATKIGSSYDSRQLEQGIEIEKEHEPTLKKIKKDIREHGDVTLAPEEVYKNISQDHLDEFGDYYTSLVEMENASEKRSPEEIQKRINNGPGKLEEK